MSPEERVVRVVLAARRAAAEPGLAEGLSRTTGLSREGVALALARHLETRPTEDEVRALVRSAPVACSAVVVLSATVFVGALRAIAWAWAGAPRVFVRPSRREPLFAAALVRALGDAAVTLAPDLDIAEVRDGEVHVYGRAETIAHLRAAARPGVRVRGHGPGLGIAVIGSAAPLDDTARALAGDVVPFDQRGCLSPRVAFVREQATSGDARTRAFAHAMAAALERTERAVPRGALSEAERGEAARFAQTMELAGHTCRGGSSVIGVSYTLTLPPPGRHLLLVPFADDGALSGLVAPLARHVTVVGRTEDAPPLDLVHARIARLGEMQRPPLDGPVDLRPDGRAQRARGPLRERTDPVTVSRPPRRPPRQRQRRRARRRTRRRPSRRSGRRRAGTKGRSCTSSAVPPTSTCTGTRRSSTMGSTPAHSPAGRRARLHRSL